MSRGDYQPIPLVWLFLIAIVAVMFAYSIVEAGELDVRQSNDMNNQTTGDVTGSRYSSSSIGVGGADYDIAGGTCRVHQGGFTVAIATFDEYCQGMGLIDRGMVNAGVRHICLQSPVGENYDHYDACETELKEIFARPEPPGTGEAEVEADDENENFHEEQKEMYVNLQMQLAILQKEADKPAQIIVKEVVPEAIQQQIDEDASRRARARAAMEEVLKGAEQ